jgi:DNA polymerase-3 subunit gamma/tau
MSSELYKKHRPTSFKEVIGQSTAVRALVDMGKRKAVPHTLLFTGPSGCGKTTLARILRVKLGCSDADFTELNCADFRGIDMVREIRSQVQLRPMAGPCRVWLIDEVHQLTAAAQDAFLKILEDTPEHVYFMLATTDPQKLKQTIRTRCTDIRVKALTRAKVQDLLHNTLQVEDATIAEEVVDEIVTVAQGSARRALVLLNQCLSMSDTEQQLQAVRDSDGKAAAIELARALTSQKETWGDIATILKGLENEDPEGVRRLVLAYCNRVLLGAKGGYVVPVICAFRDNFFDSGRAGLTLACWEAKMGEQ